MVNEAHKHPKTYSKRLSDSKIEGEPRMRGDDPDVMIHAISGSK